MKRKLPQPSLGRALIYDAHCRAGGRENIVQKPLPVAVVQPDEVVAPPNEGHEEADCGQMYCQKKFDGDQNQNKKLSEQEGRGREVLTESAEEGDLTKGDQLSIAFKADVDPEKASSQCSMYLDEIGNGTLRCEAFPVLVGNNREYDRCGC